MKANIKEYMKVGIIHFMIYPSTIKGEGPYEETLKKILVDDYFDVVELSWIKDPETKARAAAMLQQSHITVGYGAQPRLLTTGLNINDLDENKRQEALKSLKEGLDEAYELNAAGFAFLSGKYEDTHKELSYQALLASTAELCAYAKSKGDMPVLLEVFDYDVDKKSLIGPALYAAQFAVDVRRKYDNFGLLMDLSHLPLTRESAFEALDAVKDYLMHVHIGNAVCKDSAQPAFGDLHPRFGFPGGENDVDELVEFLKALFEIGYFENGKRPVVSFEVKPWGNEDPDLVIANAKRTLNEAWAKLQINKNI